MRTQKKLGNLLQYSINNCNPYQFILSHIIYRMVWGKLAILLEQSNTEY